MKQQYIPQQITDPKERISICHQCEHFIRMTTTCTKCKCFMIAKVQFKDVRCPLHKW